MFLLPVIILIIWILVTVLPVASKYHLPCSPVQIFPLLNCSNLSPFALLSSQTLSWLKDNVSMATQVCSIASFEGLEAARRCQHALEREILTNRARIEVVKRVSQGTLSYSQFVLKHKHWPNALNENIPLILQTGHLDRPGLCINQIRS